MFFAQMGDAERARLDFRFEFIALCSAPTKRRGLTAYVKGFGRRPSMDVPTRTWAVVGKPPVKEPAIGGKRLSGPTFSISA